MALLDLCHKQYDPRCRLYTHRRLRSRLRGFASRGICDVQLNAHKVCKAPIVVADGGDVQVIPEGCAIPPVVQQLHLHAASLLRPFIVGSLSAEQKLKVPVGIIREHMHCWLLEVLRHVAYTVLALGPATRWQHRDVRCVTGLSASPDADVWRECKALRGRQKRGDGHTENGTTAHTVLADKPEAKQTGRTVKGRGAVSSRALRISFTLLRSVWGPCMKRQLRPSTKSLQPRNGLSCMSCMAGVTGIELSLQLSTSMRS